MSPSPGSARPVRSRGLSIPGVPFLPQLLGGDGDAAMRAAIADPGRYAIEPKIDGVRGLIAIEGPTLVAWGRRPGTRSGWLTNRSLRAALEELVARVPALSQGTVLDGELWAGSFHRTMALITGNRPLETGLGHVVFDVPILAGEDLRHRSWQERRDRLEALSADFPPALMLSRLVEPSMALASDILEGRLEGIVIKDRGSPYRPGSRVGWTKVKAPDWHERHRERFGR